MKTTLLHRGPALVAFLSLCAVSALQAVETRKLHTYFASATVEAKVVHEGPEVLLRKYLPKNDGSVTLKKVRNTGLFEIGVTDGDRKTAARRANEVAMAIKAAFRREGAELIIRERAEAPVKPIDAKREKE